jgi:integrase
MKLQARTLTNVVKGRATLAPGRYGDGRNLYLRVTSATAMSWVFVWKTNGKSNEIGLGSFTGNGAAFRLDIEQARDKADEVRALLRKGIDPRADRKASRVSGVTFQQAMEELIKITMEGSNPWKVDGKGKCATEDAWRSRFKKYGADFTKLACSAIKREDVLDLITQPLPDGQSFWTSVVAEQMRTTVEQVLAYAKGKGYRSGENPARWEENIQTVLITKPSKSKVGRKAIDLAALPGFMGELAAIDTLAARALEFVTMTAVRKEEGVQALRAEIDLEKRLWTIPATRMKRKKDHVVPLSDQVVELIKRLPVIEGNPYLFVGVHCDNLSSSNLAKLLERMGYKGEFDIHGMRKAISRYLRDEAGFKDKEAIELCLSHRPKGVAGVYYEGHAIKERTPMMQAWADYCSGRAATNVVTLVKEAA